LSVVGIIPARAGSKRLPRKNLASLLGRPLIAHTCETLRDCGVLDALYVNTDSPEIAAAAAECGVSCPALRPAHLASDTASTRDANLFLMDVLARRGERYDAVMVLAPTSPLRTADDVRWAWELFEDHAPCAVVSVSAVAPEFWLGRIGRDGRFESWAGEETVYRLNGAIYVHRWDDYEEDRAPRKTIAYAMPAARGVDIDTRDDFELAALMMKKHVAGAAF
jgi:CMP-N-acetylneuraminic acid synthetase